MNRLEEIKHIYSAYEDSPSFRKPRQKYSEIESVLRTRQSNQENIFQSKRKTNTNQNNAKTSHLLKELELRIILQTRKHWCEMNKLKQTAKSLNHQIYQLKNRNEEKKRKIGEVKEKIGWLDERVREEVEDYLDMTNQCQRVQQPNQEQEQETDNRRNQIEQQ